MPVFSVSCLEQKDNNLCIVAYKFRDHANANHPTKAGIISITLSESFQEDREALAELAALYKLMVMKRLHGSSMGGRNITIHVSQGSIKKALSKAAIKSSDKGKTDKNHVALFSQFLATQFLEANIEVLKHGKWAVEEPKTVQDFVHNVGGPGFSKLNSAIGHVIISRHSFNRFIERLTGADEIRQGIAFEDLPDYRWSKSWGVLEAAMARAKVIDDKIPKKEKERLARKYGDKTTLLYDDSSLCILVCVDDKSYGMTLVTVLVNNEYCKIIPNLKPFSPYL